MAAKRHRHEFTLLFWHFGPYGRRDVHVHSCRPWDGGERCDRVLVGEGRECDGRPESHHRETLGQHFDVALLYLHEGDDAIHIEAPWHRGVSLCGQRDRRNLAPIDGPRPSSSGQGCWTCLTALDWIDARAEAIALPS